MSSRAGAAADAFFMDNETDYADFERGTSALEREMPYSPRALRSVVYGPPPPGRRALFVAGGLFTLTVFTTLAVGAQMALDYAQDAAPYTRDFSPFGDLLRSPRLLLEGMPFSFTLLGILLAHELGHFFACRYYGIAASYPYFIPAPTLIGTMGAFIRIRSPIVNRKALFDVGLAGPVVGFIFALPALAIAVHYSKVVPGASSGALVTFGNPLLVDLFTRWFRPGVATRDLLLDPVGRAAWVGLFCTAMNLLPMGQLDGGHLLYSLSSSKHKPVSIAVALTLLLLAKLWIGWAVWAVLPLMLGFRHPALLDRWEPLDRKRRIWALVALGIFFLCFMPKPFTMH
jgi:membrane-associated protease RseP (regulator of RpoE activity)